VGSAISGSHTNLAPTDDWIGYHHYNVDADLTSQWTNTFFSSSHQHYYQPIFHSKKSINTNVFNQLIT